MSYDLLPGEESEWFSWLQRRRRRCVEAAKRLERFKKQIERASKRKRLEKADEFARRLSRLQKKAEVPDFVGPAFPARATKLIPGSPDKVKVLASRAKNLQNLFMRRDAGEPFNVGILISLLENGAVLRHGLHFEQGVLAGRKEEQKVMPPKRDRRPSETREKTQEQRKKDVDRVKRNRQARRAGEGETVVVVS